MTLFVTKNGEVVERITDDSQTVLNEYARRRRNAWRRKSAFCQVEFPLEHRMSWNEAAKKTERVSDTGIDRYYMYIN